MSKRQPHPIEPKRAGEKPVWTSLDEKRNGARDASAELLTPLRKDEIIPTARLSRRGFLGLGAASAALATEGCIRRPVEHIYPYTKAPEYVIPGVAAHYATILSRRDEYVGALVECHEGRPTKVEGNEEHPTSLGSADIMMQAATMDLYDADRSGDVREAKGKKSDWASFDKAFDAILKTLAADGGSKLRVLVRPSNSPTHNRLRMAASEKFPHARVPLLRARLAGQRPQRRQDRVRPGGHASLQLRVREDHRLARRGLPADRAGLAPRDQGLRPRPADGTSERHDEPPLRRRADAHGHRRQRRRSPAHARERRRRVRSRARRRARRARHRPRPREGRGRRRETPEGSDAFLKAVADDLVAHKGKSVVCAGRRQPAHVHALVHALNTALENVGRTASYAPVADVTVPDDLAADLKALADDIDQNKVDVLLILGGNPVYDAPGDIQLAAKLDKVPTSIHLSSHFDETSEHCTWHLPMTHEFEAWGDGRAFDGTWSIQQPLIWPLHDGRSAIELLARFTDEAPKGYDLVRTTFKERAATPAHFEGAWKTALRMGLDAGSNSIQFEAHATLADVAAALGKAPLAKPHRPENLEIAFTPDNKLHDGTPREQPVAARVPDPMTKIVWDNAALVSPATAKRARPAKSGDLVTLSRADARRDRDRAFAHARAGRQHDQPAARLGPSERRSLRQRPRVRRVAAPHRARAWIRSTARRSRRRAARTSSSRRRSTAAWRAARSRSTRPSTSSSRIRTSSSSRTPTQGVVENGPIKRELERPGSPDAQDRARSGTA